MYLKRISLLDFKNFAQAELSFSDGVNCLVGDNGMGKTNVLDAIHYLCLTKSAFHFTDQQNIRHGKEFFMIQGMFEKEGEEQKVTVSFSKTDKKKMLMNLEPYSRMAGHIGKFPTVMISPEDAAIFWGGSEERRRFLDHSLSQSLDGYLENLMAYNKALSNRNALLKDFARSGISDFHTLDIYEETMAAKGTPVGEARKNFVSELQPIFEKYYRLLSGNKEIPGLEFSPSAGNKHLMECLKENREKDQHLQYTSAGLHRDDLIFKVDGFPVRKFGSQGQQKTYLSSLKLAQCEYFYLKNRVKPILLLDDIADKLDAERVSLLLHAAATENFGQVFLTDTHVGRCSSVFEKAGRKTRVFIVKKGIVET